MMEEELNSGKSISGQSEKEIRVRNILAELEQLTMKSNTSMIASKPPLAQGHRSRIQMENNKTKNVNNSKNYFEKNANLERLIDKVPSSEQQLAAVTTVEEANSISPLSPCTNLGNCSFPSIISICRQQFLPNHASISLVRPIDHRRRRFESLDSCSAVHIPSYRHDISTLMNLRNRYHMRFLLRYDSAEASSRSLTLQPKRSYSPYQPMTSNIESYANYVKDIKRRYLFDLYKEKKGCSSASDETVDEIEGGNLTRLHKSEREMKVQIIPKAALNYQDNLLLNKAILQFAEESIKKKSASLSPIGAANKKHVPSSIVYNIRPSYFNETFSKHRKKFRLNFQLDNFAEDTIDSMSYKEYFQKKLPLAYARYQRRTKSVQSTLQSQEFRPGRTFVVHKPHITTMDNHNDIHFRVYSPTPSLDNKLTQSVHYISGNDKNFLSTYSTAHIDRQQQTKNSSESIASQPMVSTDHAQFDEQMKETTLENRPLYSSLSYFLKKNEEKKEKVKRANSVKDSDNQSMESSILHDRFRFAKTFSPQPYNRRKVVGNLERLTDRLDKVTPQIKTSSPPEKISFIAHIPTQTENVREMKAKMNLSPRIRTNPAAIVSTRIVPHTKLPDMSNEKKSSVESDDSALKDESFESAASYGLFQMPKNRKKKSPADQMLIINNRTYDHIDDVEYADELSDNELSQQDECLTEDDADEQISQKNNEMKKKQEKYQMIIGPKKITQTYSYNPEAIKYKYKYSESFKVVPEEALNQLKADHRKNSYKKNKSISNDNYNHFSNNFQTDSLNKRTSKKSVNINTSNSAIRLYDEPPEYNLEDDDVIKESIPTRKSTSSNSSTTFHSACSDIKDKLKLLKIRQLRPAQISALKSHHDNVTSLMPVEKPTVIRHRNTPSHGMRVRRPLTILDNFTGQQELNKMDSVNEEEINEELEEKTNNNILPKNIYSPTLIQSTLSEIEPRSKSKPKCCGSTTSIPLSTRSSGEKVMLDNDVKFFLSTKANPIYLNYQLTGEKNPRIQAQPQRIQRHDNRTTTTRRMRRENIFNNEEYISLNIPYGREERRQQHQQSQPNGSSRNQFHNPMQTNQKDNFYFINPKLVKRRSKKCSTEISPMKNLNIDRLKQKNGFHSKQYSSDGEKVNRTGNICETTSTRKCNIRRLHSMKQKFEHIKSPIRLM
ncbi:hypothetical protein SNEBB_008452 [Seison nebaliae]|nr:hypothetical protein SNEBB_008452 [Seison nebaliae]